MSHGNVSHCPYLEVGQHTPTGFRRNLWIPVTDFGQMRAQLGEHGLYTSIFRFSAPDPDAELIWGPLYFDFDGEWETVQGDVLRALSYLRVVWRLEYHELRLYYSGQKGIHLTVPAPVLGLGPRLDLHVLYRSVAREMAIHTAAKTLDLKIYDRRRLFRVPGSLHHVTGRHKTPILPEELGRLSEQQIKELARYPRSLARAPLIVNSRAAAAFSRYIPQEEKVDDSSGTATIDFDPPCVLKLLQEGVTSGSRNLASAALANHLQRRGLSEAQVLEQLLEWNGLNAPPLSSREVRSTVRSIFRREYAYGCSTFDVISTCSKECPIFAHRR